MDGMNRIRVGVIGAGTCPSEIYKTAYEVGKGIAERNGVLVCGGLGGVMEASAKGALDTGGTTVGILPGEDPADANPYIAIPVPTGMGHARNVLVVRMSQVLIAVSGGYGTLSEIALGLKMGREVIGLYTWKHIPGIEHALSVEDALEKAFAVLEEASESREAASMSE